MILSLVLGVQHIGLWNIFEKIKGVKRYIFQLLNILLIFSCSTPENIAEKALKEIGSGKYKNDSFGIGFEKLKMFDNTIYSKNEIENYCAEFGYSKSLDDVFFQTERIFDNYKFIDKKEKKIDLYNYISFHNKNYNDSIFRHNAILAFKDEPKFKLDSISCQYLEYENVPRYDLRYKIENKYILNVHVIDHPKDGLKISSFMYE